MVAASSSRAVLSRADELSQPSRTRLLDRASVRAARSMRATRSRGSETLILMREAPMAAYYQSSYWNAYRAYVILG